MKQFWEESWKNIDISRVDEYINRTNIEPSSDIIIDYLKECQAKTVCDAGCGCGAYSLKLALNGFSVSGFDISSDAVKISEELMSSKHINYGSFDTYDVQKTNYANGQFDAVVCRDVIDHMTFADGIKAINELFRIVKIGGSVILTLDISDSEYETEPHFVNTDGDYLYTDGKWNGMVFHPYTANAISELVQVGKAVKAISDTDRIIVVIVK